MIAMFAACKEIAYKIRTASCDKMACFNEFGDEQLAIDVLANNVIFENLKASGCCATASSEETPVEDPMGGEVSSVPHSLNTNRSALVRLSWFLSRGYQPMFSTSVIYNITRRRRRAQIPHHSITTILVVGFIFLSIVQEVC